MKGDIWSQDTFLLNAGAILKSYSDFLFFREFMIIVIKEHNYTAVLFVSFLPC